MADAKFKDDVNSLETGLEKVDFVRNQNYLSQLAMHVSRQEKEILQLKAKLIGKLISILIVLEKE